MIVDRIENADLYSNLHSRFQAAFDFLKQDNIEDRDITFYDESSPSFVSLSKGCSQYFFRMTHINPVAIWKALPV